VASLVNKWGEQVDPPLRPIEINDEVIDRIVAILIVRWTQMRISQRSIAKILNRSQSTICRIYQAIPQTSARTMRRTGNANASCQMIRTRMMIRASIRCSA
jgi:hypothetical protein